MKERVESCPKKIITISKTEARSRCVRGVIFKDIRCRSNSASYEFFELEESVLFEIRDALQEQLSSLNFNREATASLIYLRL